MLPLEEIVLRTGCAFLSGLLVGLDRESHGRAAGLRTTILVCVAACIGMILSESLTAGGTRADPGRLAAGLLTGMGFLGAGSIMRDAHMIQGMTTAAVLWFMTILGLAFGSGNIVLGGLALSIVLFTIVILRHIESRIKNDWYVKVTVVAAMDGPSEESVAATLEALGAKVRNVDLEYDYQ